MTRSRRQDVIDRIRSIARRQVGERGPAGLSLTAIARELGLTTPALYRYFSSREALVTSLMTEAYEELGDRADEALAGLARGDRAERFRALAGTYRAWAIDHPQDYVLMHGAGVLGYRVPVEEMVSASVRILRLLVGLLADAREAGTLRVPDPYRDPPKPLRGLVMLLADRGPELDPELVTIAFMIWLHIHGLVWQELAGHVPAMFADGSIYAMEIALLVERFGLA